MDIVNTGVISSICEFNTVYFKTFQTVFYIKHLSQGLTGKFHMIGKSIRIVLENNPVLIPSKNTSHPVLEVGCRIFPEFEFCLQSMFFNLSKVYLLEALANEHCGTLGCQKHLITVLIEEVNSKSNKITEHAHLKSEVSLVSPLPLCHCICHHIFADVTAVIGKVRTCIKPAALCIITSDISVRIPEFKPVDPWNCIFEKIFF